jgi:hypothetical protein
MPETQATSPKLDLSTGTDARSRFGASRASDRARPQQSRRERIIDGLKTLLWVVPLTALIWIWAEREQLATGEVQVPVKVAHVAGDRVAILETPADHQVSLELSGPRASIDAVRDRLAGGAIKWLTVPVSVAAPFDGEVIALPEIITRSNDIFTRNAVTVTRVRPAVKIRVEMKESREVPVQVRPQDRPNGTFSFQPETVIVEGPASYFRNRGRDLTVYADMAVFSQKPPGQYQELVSVSLDEPAPDVVTIRPPKTVTAKVQIKGASMQGQLRLRTLVLIPPEVLKEDRIKVEVEDNFLLVDVTGPPELIEQIKRSSEDAYVQVVPKPRAWTNVTARGQVTVDVRAEHYQLPKELTVLNPNRTLTVTLAPRSE